MSSDISRRDQLRRIALRLETAEQALSDVRTLLADIYEHEDAPQPVGAPAPQPVVRKPRPFPGSAPASAPVVKPAPQPATPPWWKDESAVIKLVAIGGVLITLAGIGLLVALAIQHGLLGPLGRVLGAWLLAVAFLGGAFVVHRMGWSRAGRNALAITSLLTALTTTYALGFRLDWWPAVVASIVGAVVAAGFAGLARMWRDEQLLIWSMIAAALPMLAMSKEHNTYFVPGCVAFLLLFAASHQLGWAKARLVASAGTLVTFVMHAETVTDLSRTFVSDPPLLAGAIATIFVLGVLLDPVPTSRKAEFFATMWLPVIALGIGNVLRHKQYASLLAFVLVALFFAAGCTKLGRPNPVNAFLQRPLMTTMLCAFPAFYLAHWQFSPASGAYAIFSRPVFVVLFFILAACVLWWLSGHNHFGKEPWLVWLGAALVISWELGRSVLTKSPVWLTDAHAAIQVLAIAAFIAVAVNRRHALAGIRGVTGLGGLYLSALVIVTLTTFVFHLFGGANGMWLGYLVGHALVSIVWMLLAAYILLGARSMSASLSLKVGLALAVAAVIKLVFFDLGALEGVPRVIAFLISGIALLAIASLRSRRTEGVNARQG